jgi:O-antigen/teichoic acid export membrane protein
MAGISIARRTTALAALALVAAAINIGLNFALIPPFGMVGAAVAAALAYLALAWMHYVVAQRLYPTQYERPKVLAAVGLATGIGAVGAVPFGPLLLAIAVKLAALAAFFVLLRAFGVVNASEVERLRSIVGGLLRLREAQA